MRKRIWPILVSSGSAVLIGITYFIPSIQDQWDRYQSRQIIERYVELGNDFSKEENYVMAQQAYSRAFELSEEKRLDIEIKRMRAKVNQIYVDLAFGVQPPIHWRKLISSIFSTCLIRRKIKWNVLK